MNELVKLESMKMGYKVSNKMLPQPYIRYNDQQGWTENTQL